jgi:hypothetical protein
VPESVRARVAEPLATAFGNTFWWAVGLSAVALVPAVALAVSQGRARRTQALAQAQSPAG